MENKNPFVTLEALKEHVDSIWLSYYGVEDIREARQRRWAIGTVGYHLQAAEEYCGRLYQQMANLLPTAAALDAQEVTDSIIDQIGEEGN